METKIKEVYEKINNELLEQYPFGGPFNDDETREEYRIRLKNEIGDVEVKCDLDNNPPEIVDECVLVATVRWTPKNSQETKYYHLVFGQPEQAMKILKTLN